MGMEEGQNPEPMALDFGDPWSSPEPWFCPYLDSDSSPTPTYILWFVAKHIYYIPMYMEEQASKRDEADDGEKSKR